MEEKINEDIDNIDIDIIDYKNYTDITKPEGPNNINEKMIQNNMDPHNRAQLNLRQYNSTNNNFLVIPDAINQNRNPEITTTRRLTIKEYKHHQKIETFEIYQYKNYIYIKKEDKLFSIFSKVVNNINPLINEGKPIITFEINNIYVPNFSYIIGRSCKKILDILTVLGLAHIDDLYFFIYGNSYKHCFDVLERNYIKILSFDFIFIGDGLHRVDNKIKNEIKNLRKENNTGGPFFYIVDRKKIKKKEKKNNKKGNLEIVENNIEDERTDFYFNSDYLEYCKINNCQEIAIPIIQGLIGELKIRCQNNILNIKIIFKIKTFTDDKGNYTFYEYQFISSENNKTEIKEYFVYSFNHESLYDSNFINFINNHPFFIPKYPFKNKLLYFNVKKDKESLISLLKNLTHFSCRVENVNSNDLYDYFTKNMNDIIKLVPINEDYKNKIQSNVSKNNILNEEDNDNIININNMNGNNNDIENEEKIDIVDNKQNIPSQIPLKIQIDSESSTDASNLQHSTINNPSLLFIINEEDVDSIIFQFVSALFDKEKSCVNGIKFLYEQLKNVKKPKKDDKNEKKKKKT